MKLTITTEKVGAFSSHKPPRVGGTPTPSGLQKQYKPELRWYTTTENFFSDSSSIKMNFCNDVGGVPGTLKMICVSELLS